MCHACMEFFVILVGYENLVVMFTIFAEKFWLVV